MIQLLIPRGIQQICLSLENLRDNSVFFSVLGVFAAASNRQIEWVVVKGISDYADGTKDATEKWKPYASVMAASLVAHVLSQPSIFKGWGRYSAGNKFSKVRLIKDGAYLPVTQGLVYTPCAS